MGFVSPIFMLLAVIVPETVRLPAVTTPDVFASALLAVIKAEFACINALLERLNALLA